MPRTAAQNQALREERRGHLLQAALVVFARLGYSRATVGDIAREAGVSQGLMYNYFRSKEDLLQAVFERTMQDVRASFAAVPAEGRPEERLAGFVRASFDLVREHLGFWRLTYCIRFQPGVADGLGDRLAAWLDEIRSALEAHLQAVGLPRPAVAARVLFAAIDGVAQHYALDPDRYPLDEVAAAVTSRFLPTQPPAP